MDRLIIKNDRRQGMGNWEDPITDAVARYLVDIFTRKVPVDKTVAELSRRILAGARGAESARDLN